MDIFDRVANDIPIGHFEQIADATPDEAVKDENIPLYFDFFIVRKIGLEQSGSLFIGNVDRGSVNDFADGEMFERIVRRMSVVDSPQNERPKTVSISATVFSPRSLGIPFGISLPSASNTGGRFRVGVLTATFAE